MMSVTLCWLGHATFRIESEMVLYIDPWKLPSGSPKADLVIVSHGHYDHCSPPDVAAVCTSGTAVLAPPDAASKLAGDVTPISPGQRHEIGRAVVETVPAYNPGKKFHPKQNNWVGLVVHVGGKRIYYAGDTDVIPEMSQVSGIDVALLPVGGTYTMDATEAAGVCQTIKPSQAVPYHWGDIVGSSGDAYSFARQAPCPVTVLQPGESLTLT